MKQQHIFITGANGFVGRHLCRHLAQRGTRVTACVRPCSDTSSLEGVAGVDILRVAELGPRGTRETQFAGIDAVVHLAARVHVMHDTAPDPLLEFRRVNVESTEHLARTAAESGVRRFVYVSSIKVNGETTGDGSFTADDRPGYADPYGQSKWEAEQKLEEIASIKGMEWVVIRPPLVYGPDVRGNFLALMKCLRRGFPLPLGAVENQRSIVSIYNLIDLLERVLHHPNASGQRFLVKDQEDVSTAELVRRIAQALQIRPRLIPVPPSLLLLTGRLLRRRDAVQRLCSSLVVNTAKTAHLLQWRPPVSMDCGLVNTCSWFSSAASDGSL
jgi:nucleoside-diphosphate-sugar epimerase